MRFSLSRLIHKECTDPLHIASITRSNEQSVIEASDKYLASLLT